MSAGGSIGQDPMSLLSMGTAPWQANTLSSISSTPCRADTCSQSVPDSRAPRNTILLHCRSPREVLRY